MGLERMFCGCLTRVYADAGKRTHDEVCPLYVPERPLRAFPKTVAEWHAMKHDQKCPNAWVEIAPVFWNDVQRERADPRRRSSVPWYTPDCEACNVLIGIAQENKYREKQRAALAS